MRIIAGTYASRKLVTLKGDATRPTLDKVKEAVFSSLGGFFQGGRCLDLYAGSGAIGLEALSRGMDEIDFVDASAAAIRIIKENIENLGVIEMTHVYKMRDLNALSFFAKEKRKYQLVYLDPPYEQQHNEKVLELLSDLQLLKDDGIVVVEAKKEDELKEVIKTLRCYKTATYGITTIHYYRKEVFL